MELTWVQPGSTKSEAPPSPSAFPTFKIFGIRVAAIDVSRACDLIEQLAAAGAPGYVTVTGAHGIVESSRNEHVAEAHREASLVVPDGMPLVWLGRLSGFSGVDRICGSDLMTTLFSRPEVRKLRHFFYGSNPATITRLRQTLTERFGTFDLVGEYSPPIRPAGFTEDDDVIARIRALRPDIVWVSLSTPKQELWLNTHMKRIGGGVGMGVGAAFELVCGTVPRAPRWIQRSGFEWLFRTLMEPRRLFKRYATVVPMFIFLFVAALSQNRREMRG